MTVDGPRSKTLATFRTLDADVLDRAEERAERRFDRDAVTRSARRAGADVALSPAEEAARTLITEIARGWQIPPGLAGALVGYVEPTNPPKLSPEAMQAAEWAGASMRERGHWLRELMLLADALPQGRAGKPLTFPRISVA